MATGVAGTGPSQGCGEQQWESEGQEEAQQHDDDALAAAGKC
jgi:hypothetical protein